MDENLFYLLKGLLSKNGIKVNNAELKLQLFGHPSYPSLHSLTGVLDHFKIPNLAIEIPKTEENISILPEHFIAHVDGKRGNYFVLVNKKQQNFQINYGNSNTEFLSITQFIELWTGVVLIIEPDENIKTDFSPSFLKRLLLTSPILLITCFSFMSQNLYEFVHFVLSITGLTICVLILQHEIGVSSTILNKICTGVSDKISCDEVMQSKGSKLFGAIKLSDLGIIYFLTILLSSLLIVTGNFSYTPLLAISLLALPFTIFSIYYQFRIVKKWCLLCLGVVLVLWLQSAVAIASINSTSELITAPNSYLLFAITAYFTILFWLFIAPRIRQEQEFFSLKIQFNKFKRNFELFNYLLFRSTPIDTAIPKTDEIIFGAIDSKLELVIVTNPLCAFCKNAHRIIHQILSHNTDVRIVIRFNLSKNPEAVDYKIASTLLEIFHTKGEQKCLTAMDEVYSGNSYLTWLKKWGETMNKNHTNILLAQKNWCTENNILFTPEILLNGRPYPKEYEYKELQYFLEDLAEIEEFQQAELYTN